ncbi:hypothetical protein NDU88_006236 [Pleurodeles waltl]|uniref:Uncharacterized protein n=1 Tax=Pleurodeles waltl TaxID=8319 RepID=A0AAV7MZU5_PLEWA|nr:hypothetical protein NDU88_006236 [Pleurodeles waltl]
MEARNRSSSTDSDATNAQATYKRLYLMMDAPAQEQVQLVDKRQIKKTAVVDLQLIEIVAFHSHAGMQLRLNTATR